MAVQFPSSPTVNQTYAYSDKTWVWSGSTWDLVDLSIITINTTAPVSPSIGALWLSTETGDLAVYDGSYWIQSGGDTGAIGPTGPTGPTGSTGPTGATGLSGAIPRTVTITDATSVTINADTTELAIQTNTQAVGTLTINAPTGTLQNGQKIIFRLQSTNVQTFSWNAIFAGSTDLSLPTVSSGTGKYDYVGFIYNTTAIKWQLLAKNFGF